MVVMVSFLRQHLMTLLNVWYMMKQNAPKDGSKSSAHSTIYAAGSKLSLAENVLKNKATTAPKPKFRKIKKSVILVMFILCGRKRLISPAMTIETPNSKIKINI